MQTTSQAWFRGAVVAALLLCGSVGSAAALPLAAVTYLETDLGAGQWQYDFTVANNQADPGYTLYDFFLSFTSTLISATVPTDWAEIDDAATFIDAFSTMPTADILPGQSLSGFRYVFSSQIAATPFSVYFTNPDDESNPVLFEGVTEIQGVIEPTPVPEPGTLMLLACGLGALIAQRHRVARRMR